MAKPTTKQLLSAAFQHHRAGRFRDAELACREILSRQADQPDALYLLGLISHQQGNNAAARELLEQAIAVQPDADNYITLGLVLAALGLTDEAIGAYRKAIELQPSRFDAWANLGNALKMRGQLADAILAYQQAVSLQPNAAAVLSNLGVALKDAGRHGEAVAIFQRAAELWPNSTGIWANLGNALKEMARVPESKAAYRKVLEIQPTNASAWNNLGGVHQDAGEFDEAIACYRKSMELDPSSPIPHANILYLMHFDERCDAGAIYQEHERWNKRYGEPLKPKTSSYANDPAPDRPLRIGYVSPDFREHVIGRFMLPLFEQRDREQFETFCYSTSMRLPDFMTERIQRNTDHWRTIGAMSDAQLAEIVWEDRIDILVDLTMHMAGSRILLFARKPAPVQVTYLAYCSTTGLETIDYRITDPFFDPPGQPDAGRYSEQSIRIESYWCYQPIIELEEPPPPPALTNGSVTFGCFNNFAKVSTAALRTWCRVLDLIPGSRLMLHASEGAHRDRARDVVRTSGSDPARVTFVGPVQLREYFEQYRQIDIALDPFPYAGGTTTCDALWMGVPVITLAGQTGVGRGGLSILSQIGLPELVASDLEGYTSVARSLSADLNRLSELRSTMRQRMRASPLMDSARFAQNMGRAYRKMWRTWCQSSNTSQSV